MAEKATQIKHIGVIMDGNRRWARQHKLESVVKGHEKGGDKFMEICTWCQEAGIPYLTVYAFSYDNWNRTSEEITGLFDLMEKVFTKHLKTCLNRGIRVIPIGNFEKVSEKSRQILENAAEKTKHCNSLTVNIAISYGGHDETVRVARKIAEDAVSGKINLSDIDETLYKSYLDEAESPDMDLVIRTGGDKRLSGFFPWETAYSEFVYLDTLWPDMTHEEFDNIIETYYEKTRINKGK